jgi:hypothetical protein
MPMQMKYDFDVQSMEMEMNMKMNLYYRVITVDPTFYELETKFDLLSVTVNAMGNNITMSSENEKNSNPIFDFFKEITNNSFIIKIDKTGKVLEIRDFAEMIEKSLKKLPQVSKAEKEKFKQQFNQSFNEETIKQNMNNLCNYFPTTPVGIGDEWDFTYTTNASTSIIINGHYILKEITSEYIIIDVVAKVTTPEESDFVESNGMMMKLNLKGTMTGTYKLDPKTCWTISSIGKMNITGKAEVEANDQLPDGLIMDMTIECDVLSNDGRSIK